MHFVKPKVRQQIILICMFSTFIPLFIVELFSIMQARKQLSEQYESQVTTAALRINSTIFDITTSLYTSCDNLINSNYLRKLLGSDYSTSSDHQYYKIASDSLTTMHTTTAAIASIMICTNNPNIPSSSYITTVNDCSGLQWSDQIVNSWRCLTGEDSWHNKVYELSIIRRIGINSTKYSAYHKNNR